MATDPVLGSDDHGLEGLHLASHELGHVHGLVAVLALQVEQRWSWPGTDVDYLEFSSRKWF